MLSSVLFLVSLLETMYLHMLSKMYYVAGNLKKTYDTKLYCSDSLELENRFSQFVQYRDQFNEAYSKARRLFCS